MKKILTLILLLLTLTSCNNSSTNVFKENKEHENTENAQISGSNSEIDFEKPNEKNENDQKPATSNIKINSVDVTVPNVEWINPTTDQKELTLDEIENLDFYYGLMTRDELINKGYALLIDERNGMEYYTLDNVRYLFTDSREEHASIVQVVGDTSFDKLRDIEIGMTLYDALAKFPQEVYWKESSDGTFYGEEGRNKGLVELYMSSPEDGDTYTIMFTFKDSEVFVSMFVQNDIVHQINIVLFSNH